MISFNVWIYRPDKFCSKITPSGLYKTDGQTYHDWKRDQETAYDYRVRKIIQKLEGKPAHQVYDYWR